MSGSVQFQAMSQVCRSHKLGYQFNHGRYLTSLVAGLLCKIYNLVLF